MAFLHNPRAFVIMATITLFMSVLTSCGGVKIQKHTPQNIDDYKLKIQSHDFKIAVDPFKEDKRVEDYFGCDLLSKGIFPIFVMIENHNTEEGYILVNEKVALVKKIPDAKPINSVDSTSGVKLQEKQIKTEGAVSDTLTTLSPLVIPLLPVAVIFGVSAGSRAKDDNAIRKNLEDKQMLPKTLYQGGTQNGFLYFKINKKEDIENVRSINIGIKNLRTDEVSTFTIDFIKN